MRALVDVVVDTDVVIVIYHAYTLTVVALVMVVVVATLLNVLNACTLPFLHIYKILS